MEESIDIWLTKDIVNKVGRKKTFNLSSEREKITPFIKLINQFLDICLEEKEDTGKSELSFGIASKDNLVIKNVDMKHTDLYFFKIKEIKVLVG